MSTPVYILGIDLSTTRLDCATLPDERSFQVPYSPAGFQTIIEHLVDRRAQGWQVLAVVEATGGYERALVAALLEAGLPIAVVNPKRVRAYAKGLGILVETDRLDARVIARYGREIRPRPAAPVSPERRDLAELLAYRDQLVGEIVARTQQKRLYTTAAMIGRADTALARLRQEKRDLDREIARMLDEGEALSGTAVLLLSVCGVGPVVAAVLLAFLPELGRLTEKEIASLAGLAPMARDSGNRRGRRHIADGRAKGRHALYMAVAAALKNNAHLRAVYDRLIRAGKPVKVAMVAVMRKLVVMLNTMLRDGETWEPDAQKRWERRAAADRSSALPEQRSASPEPAPKTAAA
jgi:transposase